MRLVKHYIVKIWEARKIHPSLSPQTGIWGMYCGLRGRGVRLCVREVSLTLVSFTHWYENGCMVDAMCATAAD